MIKRYKAFIVGFGAVETLILFVKLDFIAGKVPQFHPLVAASRFLSFIGSGLVLTVVSVALYLLGRALKDSFLRKAGGAAFFSSIVAGVFVQILKAAFERPRPSALAEYGGGFVIKLLTHPSLVSLSGRFDSFPSGHATASFAVAYALSRSYPRYKTFFYGVASLVALSRVYLGSHYPSDIAAGAILGIAAGYLAGSAAGGEVDARNKWLKAGLIILALFVSFFKSGGFLLFDVDEAVFSEASREMAETHNYITPTYNYEPRYDKPALFYWLMTFAFKLFGVSEWSARFTSAAFGTLLVLMTYAFVKRARGELPAILCALALLLNLEYFVYSHSAVTDMTLAFFIAASVFSFYMAVSANEERWYFAFWAASALAVLTKGAVGVVFPFITALAYLYASKNLAEMKTLLRPAYIAVFLVIAVPWYALELYVNGWDFVNAFIIKHHIKRFTEVISSHGGPFYYYIGVLGLGFFPWAAFLPQSVYRGFRDRRAGGLYLLTSIWFILVFVFFSAASTKLPNYILPLLPAASIMAGLSVSELVEYRTGKAGLYILIILSVIVSAAAFAMPYMNIRMDAALPHLLFPAIGAVFLIIAALSATALLRPLPSFLGIACLTLILLVSLRLYALPPINLFLQKDLYDFSTYAKRVNKSTVFATYEVNKPSITFYAARKVEKIEKRNVCDVREFSKKGKLLLITERGRLGDLSEYNLNVIDSRGRYVLLANTTGLPPFEKETTPGGK